MPSPGAGRITGSADFGRCSNDDCTERFGFWRSFTDAARIRVIENNLDGRVQLGMIEELSARAPAANSGSGPD